MEKELFDELMAACHEAVEHEKGNISLNYNTIDLADEEIEKSQVFYRNFSKLTDDSKQKAIEYVDELLKASI